LRVDDGQSVIAGIERRPRSLLAQLTSNNKSHLETWLRSKMPARNVRRDGSVEGENVVTDVLDQIAAVSFNHLARQLIVTDSN